MALMRPASALAETSETGVPLPADRARCPRREPLYLAKYIERMGTGTGDMIRRCRDVGLPGPQFALTDGFVTVIRRRTGQVTGQVAGQVTGQVTETTVPAGLGEELGERLGETRDGIGRVGRVLRKATRSRRSRGNG